ncbi:Chemotaxis protein CheD [hydrothermal vent metagenome]|uniref:Chemotaxis protein CheD n=1 Tax=hydrothermal vent metagenome TaxID=652676 RepID=A0A3B1BMC7_9ZZZZ
MERKRVFILPGEIAISKQPTIIATLLGSCVAVCLYNKKLRFGGMNHFMLPDGSGGALPGKYGNYATNKLIATMLKADGMKSSIEAKVFGGSAVVGHLSAGMNIGKRNIETAMSILNSHAIKIVDKQTGGNTGMKIFFDNHTGEVEKRDIVKSEHSQQLSAKKQEFAKRKIRVLVVDDSATIRNILNKALNLDDGIEVVGEAENAFDARSKILELDPDVITLDIIMPKMDGVSFLKKLMLHYPKPVIIVSSVAQKGSKMRFRASDIGAVDVVDKEDLKLYQGIESVHKVLSAKIKMAATTIVKKKTEEEIGHI